MLMGTLPESWSKLPSVSHCHQSIFCSSSCCLQLCSLHTGMQCYSENFTIVELALYSSSDLRCLLGLYCHLQCNAFDDAQMLMQLSFAFLSSNRLEGSLPEAWSNLTNVSPAVELTLGASLCERCFLTGRLYATLAASMINKLTHCTTSLGIFWLASCSPMCSFTPRHLLSAWLVDKKPPCSRLWATMAVQHTGLARPP